MTAVNVSFWLNKYDFHLHNKHELGSGCRIKKGEYDNEEQSAKQQDTGKIISNIKRNCELSLNK